MNKQKFINISEFQKHIFWNYKPDSELDKSIIIENVLMYGELSDYKKLLNLVSKKDIASVTDQIEKTGRFKKRINFIRKVILSDQIPDENE